MDLTLTSPDARAEIDVEVYALSAEAEAGVEAGVEPGPDGDLYVVVLSRG